MTTRGFPVISFRIGGAAKPAPAAPAPAAESSANGAAAATPPTESAPAALPVAVGQPLVPAEIAAAIARNTLRIAIQAELIGSAEAQSRLKAYSPAVTEERPASDILLFMAESTATPLAETIRRLNEKMPSQYPTWDFARRLEVPSTFYHENPAARDFCRALNAPLLEVSDSRAIITIGVLNPVACADLEAGFLAAASKHLKRVPYVSFALIPPNDFAQVLARHFATNTP